MSRAPSPIPPLFARLLDDAAVFPPGNASLAEALSAHGQHRAAWYADLVGPLLVPASWLNQIRTETPLAVGVIADAGLESLPVALRKQIPNVTPAQVEAAVAKRGEDPMPGIRQLLTLLDWYADPIYVEVPLTWGLLDALDSLATARASGRAVAAKFRTGGLAAELFPTPMELAAVICACRDRDLPFKLTAGLHHAMRHTDPETGFTHHGFLNIMAATCAAAEGAEVVDVAALLGTTQPLTLLEAARSRREQERPLWVGFGTCSVPEPLEDLVGLALLHAPKENHQ
jgi:hypothetical protein